MLPLSAPIRGRDGKMLESIFVPKGTAIGLGTLATNRSKTIWGEDALEWKPERWLRPAPPALEEARMPGVYSNMSVASRFCVGAALCLLGLLRVAVCRSLAGRGRASVSSSPSSR